MLMAQAQGQDEKRPGVLLRSQTESRQHTFCEGGGACDAEAGSEAINEAMSISDVRGEPISTSAVSGHASRARPNLPQARQYSR